jgi:hypothetical protein
MTLLSSSMCSEKISAKADVEVRKDLPLHPGFFCNPVNLRVKPSSFHLSISKKCNNHCLLFANNFQLAPPKQLPSVKKIEFLSMIFCLKPIRWKILMRFGLGISHKIPISELMNSDQT